LSDLDPSTVYDVQLVATNRAGTTYGPEQALRTKARTVPASSIGQDVDLTAGGGTLLFKPPASMFSAADGVFARQDATAHGTQTATLTGAIITISQTGTGLTTVTIDEHAYPGAPSCSTCRSTTRAAVLQMLRISAHGQFGAKVRYSPTLAATRRGASRIIAILPLTTGRHGTIEVIAARGVLIRLHWGHRQ
jgi:hypothetical protein